MGAFAAVAAAPGSAAAATQTFTSDGTFTVPNGVTSVSIDVLGAKGGLNDDGPADGAGGFGGEAGGTVAVTAGEALSVLVGGVGAPSDGSKGGSGGGGGGGGGGTVAGSSGGGGGGCRSEVDRGSTQLLVAGGGGGGSFGQGGGFEIGGAGGGLTGLPGDPGQVSGGSQTQAGMGGQGDGGAGAPGQKDQGGNGAGGDEAILGGGGGGGGFFGGGGGGSSMSGDPGSYCGGGGGSGHLDPSVTDGTMRTGVNGGAGRVTLTYTEPASSTSTATAAPGASAASGGTPPAAAPPLITVPSEPANAFEFARVRVGVQQLRLGFDYPGRGTLDVLVTTRPPGAASASLRPGGRRVTVGKLRDRAENPETHTLRVPLTHRGTSILGRRGKLPVRLSLVFTPDGGQSSRQARKYTVRAG